jgi:hypothetical protein
MPPHRRYTKREKAQLVVLAEAGGTRAAAAQSGVPESTIRYWSDSPEFAQLRLKTREDLAVESRALSHKVVTVIEQRLAEFEPRDLAVLYGILIDKSQLLGGHATERVESRELDVFDDHETRAIVERAREYLAGRATGEGAPVAETPAVEGAGS